MSLSFWDLNNIRNSFFCACFTGQKLKGRNKNYFFHDCIEHLKELEIKCLESFHDALATNYSLVLSPSQLLFPRKKGKGILVVLKNTCGFHLNAKEFVILKINFYYFMYNPVLVFLCLFSCNRFVLYSEYICTDKNTWMYPKCTTWKQQWWFLRFRQLHFVSVT